MIAPAAPGHPDAVTIIIPGGAKGKARPRFNPKTKTAFTPKPTRTREGIVASLAMASMAGRGGPFAGEVEMAFRAIMAVPKSWPKWKRAAALNGEIRPTGKPDLDNCAKLVWDSLNGIVYVDDSQIVKLIAEKVYGAEAKTIVTVREVQAVQS